MVTPFLPILMQISFSLVLINNDFANVIYGSKRDTIERSLVLQRPRYPSLKAIDWRVGVSLLTSSLMRSLEPSVLLKNLFY